MKALELLKADRDYCNIINNDKSIIAQYDEAIAELEEIEEYVEYLEEYRRLVRTYLQVEKCSCGALKVKGYLCSNKDCEEE